MSSLSDLELDPNAFEHLIRPGLSSSEGLAGLQEEISNNPNMRRAILLRTAVTLRSRLQALPFEASTAEPVTIEAQDALVLLDLLLRRLG